MRPPSPIRLLHAPLILLVACGAGINANTGYGSDADDEDGDGYPIDEDCDDTNPDIHPGAPEVCNGIDDDCNGAIDLFDEGLTDGIAAFTDRDGDGYGDPDLPTTTCELGAGAVEAGGDCNDTNPNVHPGATEDCNTTADDDCDGDTNAVDAANCVTWYADADGDGFAGDESACLCEASEDYPGRFAEDCDDGDDAVHPDALEICNDGVDNDCDDRPGDCELSGSIEAATVAQAVTGLGADDRLGSVVAPGGDLTGDGAPDLLAVAPGFNGGAGAVAVFSDDFSARIPLDEGTALLRGSPGDGLSTALGGLDLTGDGITDAVVASRTAEGGSGRIWIWPGPTSGVQSTDALSDGLIGPTGDEAALLGSIGDVSGDGVAELIVGSYVDGDVYVYSGPLSGTQSLRGVSQQITGAGTSLADVGGVGDLDGDGVEDLGVGAEDRGGAGRAWVVTGLDSSFAELADADATVDGGTAGDRFGAQVVGLGDLTGDGYDDLFVGAPGLDWDSADEGGGYVLPGPLPSGASSASDHAVATLEGQDYGDNAGEAVGGDADVNGDGVPDLVIGCGSSDENTRDDGMTYLVYGPVSGITPLRAADAIFVGEGLDHYLGASVALPGDLDGDGFDDLTMGSPGHDGASESVGAVYFAFGGGF